MKKRNFLVFGLGVIAGALLAPKKGEENRRILVDKMDEIYLSAKELKIDDIKEKIEDIKIDISKIDYTTSKEYVLKQSSNLKTKLNELILILQENKKIQPALEKAIDKTQDAILSTIDYIEEKELIDKTKDAGQKVVEQTKEVSEKFIQVTKENSALVKEKFNDTIKNNCEDHKKTNNYSENVVKDPLEESKEKKEDDE